MSENYGGPYIAAPPDVWAPRGMSAEDKALRDQFAMAAPPVPEWFMALPAVNGQWAGRYVPEGASAFDPVTDEREQSRFFAWRWHYADMMMQTRQPNGKE